MVSSPDSDGHHQRGAAGAGGGGEGSSGSGAIKEQDRLLPIANVGRIMKQILPPNAKISKEAKETMQECVSEFISFVTGEASDKCHKEKRKTVNGDDICWALATLGFDDYAEPMRRYLQKYRETEGDRGSAAAASGSNQGRGGGGPDVVGDSQPGSGQLMFNAMDRNPGSSTRRY
ncbi:nuclear transcription factor Y subunit B-4-like [Iris pallida]|uniref:Nuclear transcription factor Y subunit B-4-like n=1 Tax=Iris pallida TaxID=29817 RepID=A0AAX6I3Y7_IRIPA|nr:nuclear transcription factor Y subunit B-4-like [Iris pallida]KAJ6847788.1 nuclear transcription factor Y subunit B-4-like [Iris pallida]KAJ6847789.1 nuclear transcription factor Y subunit B-4-like [Iris pallida]